MGKFAKNNKAGMIKTHHLRPNPLLSQLNPYYAQLCNLFLLGLRSFFLVIAMAAAIIRTEKQS
jgi:hypothetical protein